MNITNFWPRADLGGGGGGSRNDTLEKRLWMLMFETDNLTYCIATRGYGNKDN